MKMSALPLWRGGLKIRASGHEVKGCLSDGKKAFRMDLIVR
jgi:hypothetical protein